MSHPQSITFRANAARALEDQPLRAAMRHATETFAQKRAAAVGALPIEAWREEASWIRLQVLDNLTEFLDRFVGNATKAGAIIHRAVDGPTASRLVADILTERGIRKVVKSKSMVSEEIHLNHYLAAKGVRVVETDLGEYIIQIAGEKPSHIIVPAIHKDRRQVGRLFAEKLGIAYTDDPVALTKIARRVLREEFLSAGAGISGANFAIADTGSLAIFTNEGNGRLVTTVPLLHIAVLSIEKILPALADLPKFIRLLPRSATGQVLTTYLSLITGTRKPGQATGARELHIVLVDNGRSKIIQGPYREMLKCIRCGACLNVCPVYRLVGGHAYGTTYPGPMGVVLTNLLDGLERAHPLLDATTLCGACAEVCPVQVPLPQLLRKLREARVAAHLVSGVQRGTMAGFGWVTRFPGLFHLAQKAARIFWPLAGLVVHKISGHDMLGRLPVPVACSFRRRKP